MTARPAYPCLFVPARIAIATRTKEALRRDQRMLAALQIRQAGPVRGLKSA